MRSMFLALVMAGIATNAATAQEVQDKPQPASKVRIAVVNFEWVLNHYEKAREVKDDVEKTRRTPTKEMDKKKSMDNIVRVWKEIQNGVRSYAADHDIDLVLGYSDPVENDALDRFPNILRKLQALDLGNTVAHHASPRADISRAVTDLLNNPRRDKIGNKAPTATSSRTARVAFLDFGYVRGMRYSGSRKEHVDDTTAGQQERSVKHWKEIQGEIRAFATRHDIDLILGCAEPSEKALLDQFSNISRKLQTLDQGGTVPLLIGSHADISEAVKNSSNNQRRDGDDNKPAKMVGGTDRAAVVNISYVFKKCKKAQTIKVDFEAMVRPYMEKSKLLGDDIKTWEKALRESDFAIDSEDQFRTKINEANGQIRELQFELASRAGNLQETKLVELWHDVQGAVKTHATRHGIDLVLAYGDPPDKDLRDQFPNVNRKIQAMDNGGTIPLFIAPRVEIGEGIVELLNKTYRD